MIKFLLAVVMVVSLTLPAPARSEREHIIHAGMSAGISRTVITHVAKRESGFRCSPNNPKYFGPLQISYPSAKALGYKGARNGLNNCGAGLTFGLRHLKLCYDKVGNHPTKAAHCHAMPAKYGVRVQWKK
ncbi:lytic transglycosylase [Ochrobactrum phage vB_OspM_OC]|nr:lytic transglycosylase [Ochrobactrum phage vB_OspM_OC]